ncbi:hypothetical protein [Selenomonas ruminantium]|uniref:phage nozzle protein n=1 Tax=Selenomonas ruminantium TaxID=971 RepID=UPI0026EC2012|nr:hypothetical protein [Selenomonas ruminantium]
MGTAYYMQPSFSGGEFDPKVLGRIDSERYATGLKQCENFFIHKFGSVSNRTGFLYLGGAKYNDKRCRLIPFIYSSDQAYVLEFGYQYIRFWNSDGSLVMDGDNPVEVSTPYTVDQLRKLRFVQSADKVFIACQGLRPMVLTRNTLTSWSLENFNYKRGPFLSQNLDDNIKVTPSGTSGSITLTANADIFKAGQVGSVWRIDQNMSGGTVVIRARNLATDTAVSDTITCGAGTTWQLITHGVDWVGRVAIERSYDNGTTWLQVRSFPHKANESNWSETVNESEQCLLRINIKELTTTDKEVEASLTVDPYVNTGYVTITGYTSATSVTASVDSEKPIGNTNATAMWWEAAWSSEQGYPAAVAFYEDRLTFAGTKGSPRGVWMSKAGDYNNFEISSPTSEDDDSIQIVLTSRKMSIIHTLVPMRQSLMAFSEDGVNTISYADSSLTPSSVTQRAESYFGAKEIEPLIVGAQCVYVQEVGGAVRDIGYDYVQDAYSGDEVSLFSSFLVNKFTPVEMTYQSEPDSIIWFVREDGQLLSCTYLREQKMVAWAHHTTQGEFESVCAIPYNNNSRVWAAVKRTVGGQTVRYIECMTNRLPTEIPADQIYMDSAMVFEENPAAKTFAVPHLAGCQVKVVLDGNLLPDYTVGDDGTLTIERAGNKAVIGLGYVSKLETVNIEAQGFVRQGVMQGHKIQIAEIILRLLNTRGGKVGSDEEHLDEWQRRTRVDFLGNALDLFTGDARLVGNFTKQEGGNVMIVQDVPMPFTLLAIMMGVKVSDG